MNTEQTTIEFTYAELQAMTQDLLGDEPTSQFAFATARQKIENTFWQMYAKHNHAPE